MELLIAAQVSESFDVLKQKIKVERIQKILGLERNEDLRIRICDRICLLMYQDSSFGLVKQIGIANRQILEYCRNLCKSWIDKIDAFKNSNEDWLAGKQISNFALERILSSWLVICELLDIDGVPEILKIAKCYSSTLEFCQKLLNNDERCLTTTVLLLPYSEKLRKSIFDVRLVVFSIFRLIDFETEVIIDWLNSELVAISVILRILKIMVKNEKDWRNLEIEQSLTITPSSSHQSYTNANNSTPKIDLRIVEIIGDTVSAPKSIEISRKSLHCAGENAEIHVDFAACFGEFQEMLDELATKLEKLRKRRLVPENYTTLIGYCRRVASIV